MCPRHHRTLPVYRRRLEAAVAKGPVRLAGRHQAAALRPEAVQAAQEEDSSMFEILRRFLSLDSSGIPLEEEFEAVRDDGHSLRSVRTQILNRCPNCHRPTRVQEIKGVCEYCRAVMTCTMCFHLCAICSRILCGHCAKGLWLGESRGSVTLCPDHLDQARNGHDALDVIARKKAEFERLTMLELEKLRIIESPVMEGKLMNLVKKGVALSMLRNIWQSQRQLRQGK